MLDKRLQLEIPKDLHDILKAEACKRDVSLKILILRYVLNGLERERIIDGIQFMDFLYKKHNERVSSYL